MSAYSDSILRLIDANVDRLSEGLRVLEDVARFILEDITITNNLREVRHQLAPDLPYHKRLLAARSANSDIGRGAKGARGTKEDMIGVIASNAKRAQESLRVLEEFAKLSNLPVDLKESSFQEARFTLYEIEKELTLKLVRQDKKNKIKGLYVILDTDAIGERGEVEAAHKILIGGARVIQLRDKHKDKESLVATAKELKQACNEAGVLLIINDYIDLALAADADGVHLGEHDLPIPTARRILPPSKIIGRSVRTVEQAQKVESEGADYLGVGSIYASPTKPEAKVIGLERLRQIKDATSLPVVAIGGISHDNVDHVIGAGADAIAVIDAVLRVEDISRASRELAAKFEGQC